MSEIRVKSTGTIKLYESDNTSHVTIASPASLSANRTITIPDADVTLGAGTTINNNANNRIITGSGTANTLEGESTLTYDGTNLDLGDNKSIRLGDSQDLSLFHNGSKSIIQDSGTGNLEIRGTSIDLVNAGASETYAKFVNDGAVELYYNNAKSIETYGDGVWIKDNKKIKIGDGNDAEIYSDGTNSKFAVANGRMILQAPYYTISNADNSVEFVRVASDGDVQIGTSSEIHSGGEKLAVNGASSSLPILTLGVTHTSVFGGVKFRNGNGEIGSVTYNASGVAYNTSSDYRLKENETPITDGITRLKTLKPYRFNFKKDPDETVDGFFAHEVTAVPEAVSGIKDATEKYTDENGDEQTRIIPQGIDQSKLVPLLVASVQELIAENETLKTRITALENK